MLCHTLRMSVRFAALAALAAWIVLGLLTQSTLSSANAQTAQAEPPRPARTAPTRPLPTMFSPWSAETLRDILKLEEHAVAQLERQLAANPEDFQTRLKLMARPSPGGEVGWAVLCSVKNSTALFAFRNGNDTNPETVGTSQHLTYLQGLGNGKIGYSHAIPSANRDSIMGHYRAYGAPSLR